MLVVSFPLAPWLGSEAAVSLPSLIGTALADDDYGEEGEHAEERTRNAWEDVHEFFANLTLALVLLHISGVVLGSVVHRENLVRAMIDGRKRH